MWTIRTGDDSLVDLQGSGEWSESDLTLRVDESTAHRWADAQVDQVAELLSHPPLILPTALVEPQDPRTPGISRLWRDSEGRGSVGRLRTWLFIWWLSQSDHGGITAAYPQDNRSLLRPFVERQPTFAVTIRPNERLPGA